MKESYVRFFNLNVIISVRDLIVFSYHMLFVTRLVSEKAVSLTEFVPSILF